MTVIFARGTTKTGTWVHLLVHRSSIFQKRKLAQEMLLYKVWIIRQIFRVFRLCGDVNGGKKMESLVGQAMSQSPSMEVVMAGHRYVFRAWQREREC